MSQTTPPKYPGSERIIKACAFLIESVAGKNLIPNSKGIEWKSLENGAYNWKTDSFIVFDGSTWVTASKEATANIILGLALP